ncbi:hypothetical protein [Streptacidiphilus rugosus]|uniref:hypothetical protein n=1 Tax=Streptacidiphilus rugosus TaxID=405783 RepID=UPI0012FCE099|nr:hypothetical protein [Streptacidiphilus rugosus]
MTMGDVPSDAELERQWARIMRELPPGAAQKLDNLAEALRTELVAPKKAWSREWGSVLGQYPDPESGWSLPHLRWAAVMHARLANNELLRHRLVVHDGLESLPRPWRLDRDQGRLEWDHPVSFRRPDGVRVEAVPGSVALIVGYADAPAVAQAFSVDDLGVARWPWQSDLLIIVVDVFKVVQGPGTQVDLLTEIAAAMRRELAAIGVTDPVAWLDSLDTTGD